MKRQLIACLFITLSYLTPLAVIAQQPASRKPVTKPATTVAATKPVTKEAPVKLKMPQRQKNLRKAWDEGKLPAPLTLPPLAAADNSPAGKINMFMAVDQRATDLAAKISAGDENSLAALETAVLDSGFIIEAPDGTQQKTTGAQGMTFPAYQIAATAKLYGQNQSVSLKSFSQAFTKTIKPFRDLPFDDLLLEGIRKAADSDKPALRFWAQFIIAMGKRSKTSYDLYNVSLPKEDISFDPIQRTLILTKLGADMSAYEHVKNATGRFDSRNQVQFQNASFRGELLNRFSPFQGAMRNELPIDECKINNNESTILDWTALIASNAFGGLVEELDKLWKLGANVKKYTSFAGIINIVFTVLKFMATYASMEIALEIPDGSITRTKTTTAGEEKPLTAYLEIDMPKWLQLTNCVRPAFNAVGLDFSLPTNGAMSNVKVTFVLQEDEGKGGSTLHNSNIDEDFGLGNEHDSTPVNGVYLKANSGRAQYTDQNGSVRITLAGAPQDKDLSRKKLQKVERRVSVVAYAQAKTTNPESAAEIIGTIGDLLGPILAMLGGDKLSASVGVITESFYRANWWGSDAYPITVHDWEACGGGWSGVISKQSVAKEERNDSGSTQGFIHRSSESTNISETVVVKFRSTTQGQIGSASANRSSLLQSDLFNECANGNARGNVTTHEKTVGIAKGDVPATVSVDIRDGRLFISADMAGIPITQTFEKKGTNSCDPNRGNYATGGEVTVGAKQNFSFNFSFDKALTNEEAKDPDNLHGSLTVTAPDGITKTIYTWNLFKCDK